MKQPQHPIQRKQAQPHQAGPGGAALAPPGANSPTLQRREAPNRTGLPDHLKSGIENMSGMAMDDVKVHYNSSKPAQLNAHAYAQGTDIHVASGQEKHLPHEAWHVVQQKQGRVQPTMSMNGAQINNNPGLEQEADVMGGKAVQRKPSNTSPSLKSVPISPQWGVVQGKWILRNGKPTEVPDDYVLQLGETDMNTSYYQQDPRIIFNEGSKIGRYDEHGKLTIKDFDTSGIPVHDDLQKTREQQGGLLGTRLQGSGNAKQEADLMKQIADQLEVLAKDNLPKNHAAKTKKLANSDFSGGEFRNVIKSQDEFTQSESTTAFFKGLREKLGSNATKEERQFMEEALRAYSALRARTGTVSAPLEYQGSLAGQQHPTSWAKHEKLPGGGSGHSFADRQRVDLQNQAFANLAQNPNTSPTTLVLGNLLSALVATLSTMASPHSASNVPDFDTKNSSQQFKEREQIKQQTLFLEKNIGLGDHSGDKQPIDNQYKKRKRASSPVRDKNTTEDTSEPKITKKVMTQKPLPSFQDLLKSLQLSKQQTNLFHLINRLLSALQNNPNTVVIAQQLIQLRTQVQQVQPQQFQASYLLGQYQANVAQLYLLATPYINRPTAAGLHGGVAGFQTVNRLNSLGQFMAECGQMAVHNVIALQHAQNTDNFPQLNNYLQNQQHLNSLGLFQNNISEDQIRLMLAQANRQGIPVIGNLAQLQTMIRQYNAAEGIGTAFMGPGFGRIFLQNAYAIGGIEVQEVEAMNQFLAGQTDQINFIVNTTGGEEISAGQHWITVRLERRQNGIHLFFLDSLTVQNNYANLFTALNHLLNGQDIIPQAQGDDSSSSKPKHSNWF